MTKRSYKQRVRRNPRWSIAKANLTALDFLFWEFVRDRNDKESADLLALILRERLYEAVASPQPWESFPGFGETLITIRAKHALIMLKDLPKIGEGHRVDFPLTKKTLWNAVIRGWLKTDDAESEAIFGRYLLSITTAAHSEAECSVFEATLREELDLRKEFRKEECLLRIERLFAYFPDYYREEVVRIITRTYAYYAEPSRILRKFGKSS
jgi:hypothetical protein